MNPQRSAQKTVDVVIPAFNEEASIGAAIEALFEAVRGTPFQFELIVVDDGSTDHTAAIVESYFDRYPVTLVRLSRNFGKEAALLAGLDHARGDATVLMDADLQHPVDLIPVFLKHWQAGFQCVYAVRSDRAAESLAKRAFAKAFYTGINGDARVRVPEDAGDFRLLDRQVVAALRTLRERVRFTKGLYAWLGFRSIGVPFVPPPRERGVSHFDARALLRLGCDGLTSFSDLPLRVAGYVGAAVAAVALGYALFIVARTVVLGVDVPGWATLTVAITFLSGLQILFLGVLGQYVRNVFIETKQRPAYVVQELASSIPARGDVVQNRLPNAAADAYGYPRNDRAAA